VRQTAYIALKNIENGMPVAIVLEAKCFVRRGFEAKDFKNLTHLNTEDSRRLWILFSSLAMETVEAAVCYPHL
jgi:hypothetical protein